MDLNSDQNIDDESAAMLTTSDISFVNEYSTDSSLSETQPISVSHGIVNEIINNTFDEQHGICTTSSSQCSSLKCHSSEYSYDKRLEYWKNILKERERISSKIEKQTKKHHSEVLYNRLVTVDERDKFTLKSLMDYAQRLNPTRLSVRQPSALKEKCDAEMSKLMPEVRETLPQTERRKIAQIEITGVPAKIQNELIGRNKWQGYKKRRNWLDSKYLETRIEDIRTDMERVVEYYPDTENLEIVGEALSTIRERSHNSGIQIMSSDDICKISNDTHFEDDACDEVSTNSKSTLVIVEYAFIVNNVEFLLKNYRSNRTFEVLENFSCFPFETEVKKVLTIKNIGRKVLDFEWVNRSFYGRNSNLLKCYDNEFVFDNIPFRLCSGELREIFVKFQPRRVNVVRSKWLLKVKPLLFKRKKDGILMSLSGVGNIPIEYEQKLQNIQREIIKKSNKNMIKKLTTNLATLAVGVITNECSCPYQHSLNEMELFEQSNSGYKCNRYNDLEILREIYKSANKTGYELWDLKVGTLRDTVMKVSQTEDRIILFNKLSDVLSSMKGYTLDLDTKIFDNSERYRSRFLYVRGIISAAIDEWVELVSTLEETFYQTTLQAINKEFVKENIEEMNVDGENKKLFILPEDEVKKRQYIVEKHVRKLKSYRDASYMQTYTLLCDFMENIVNIIESTI